MAKVIIAGDLFPTESNIEYFKNKDIKAIFGPQIVRLFNEADYCVCNLEGTLCDDDTKPISKDGPNLRAPVETIVGIAELGIDSVSLANNHSSDYGTEGFAQTLMALERLNISSFGAGRNIHSINSYVIAEVDGIKIGFYGVSETVFNIPDEITAGANLYDEYRVCKEILDLKKECSYVIVLYHGGIEHFLFPTDEIRKRFHRMADSGADVVLAQHTHCIGEEEIYNGAYLLYGQGNFCLNFRPKPNQWNLFGLFLEVNITKEGLTIYKHMVKRNQVGTSYDNEQDFTMFLERSERVQRGDSMEKEFSSFADDRIIPYLEAFRGKNLIDKIIKRIMPKYYRMYLKSRFTKQQLLKILNALRSDEFGAIAIKGVENLLNKDHAS